jgi:succinoglycan biosynthesis transport protein ExoP
LTDIGGKLLSEQQLTEMNSRLVSAKAQTAEAKARLDRILDISKRGIEDAAVGDSLQNTVLNRLQQQYIDAAKREAGFSSRYGSDHVAALNLRKEMQQIQDVSKTEMNRILESYKSEFEIARSREQTLQESLDQLTAASVGIRDAQVRLRWLETSANAYRTLHDTYLNRLLEATQQESFPTTEARLITEAATAEKTYPKTSLVLGIVGLIGLAFGCAFAFAREVLDRTFRTGPQVEQALGIQYLGTMPTVLDLPMPPPTGSVPQKGPRTITGNLGIAHQVVRASFSGFSETIRRIKVAADTSAVMGNCKVIGIVSALPGEGKSTVACNLAQLMAHSGQHALLIDCDLRTPCLSSQLTPDAKQGILEVLEDVAQLSDTVWRDSITGLDFLPTVLKAPVAHTSTLLGSHRMAKILDLARTKYDYIVIDLPPLAPLIDAEAVAHNVDAFVLVIEWGQTLPEEITEALGLARAVHYKLLGTVLNKANEVKLGKLEVCSSSQVSRRSL